MLIARLIADKARLSASLDAASAMLEAQGMRPARVHMPDSGSDVLQLSFAEGDAGFLREALDEHFKPSDLIVSEAEIAIPRLFVSDMDSTMIGQECIDELADFAGIKPQIAAITERAMRGELNFESALRERVGLLAGLEEGAIQRCLEERIFPVDGARVLVQTLKSKGCRTVLVTGGFHHFADAVAAWLGFERVVGNRLDVAGGKLTGGLAGPVSNSFTKLETLEQERAALSGGEGEGLITLATGDGANDIPMLQAASYGVAYRAKPIAREAANGWVDRGDLTSILRLLGIPESEWVTG